jgi:hypothetical protein
MDSYGLNSHIMAHCNTTPETPRLTRNYSGYHYRSGLKMIIQMCAREDSIVFFRPGVHHYKACAEGSEDGLAECQSEIHAAMLSVPLATGLCPEQWKNAINVMLEKIPGVLRSNKL